jgi:hypothetical protein
MGKERKSRRKCHSFFFLVFFFFSLPATSDAHLIKNFALKVMLHTVAYSQMNKTASFFFRVGGGYNFFSDSPLIGCLKETLQIIIMQLFW